MTVYTVVLTGGIASGKTAVSDLFASFGVPVIDTDLIARDVVKPGTTALARIVDAFGESSLDSMGGLNRKRMRDLVFSDPAKRRILEGILHPAIAGEVARRVGALDSGYCIVVIPLYLRTSDYAWIDRVLVVDVEEETQRQRVMARDGISREQAQAILNAQSSRQERLDIADDVIENSGRLSDLQPKVSALHEKYTALSE